MRKILKKYLNYSWLLAKTGRILTAAILAWLRRFLQEMTEARSEGRSIFYSDETYINAHHSSRYMWCRKDALERGTLAGLVLG